MSAIQGDRQARRSDTSRSFSAGNTSLAIGEARTKIFGVVRISLRTPEAVTGPSGVLTNLGLGRVTHRFDVVSVEVQRASSIVVGMVIRAKPGHSTGAHNSYRATSKPPAFSTAAASGDVKNSIRALTAFRFLVPASTAAENAVIF